MLSILSVYENGMSLTSKEYIYQESAISTLCCKSRKATRVFYARSREIRCLLLSLFPYILQIPRKSPNFKAIFHLSSSLQTPSSQPQQFCCIPHNNIHLWKTHLLQLQSIWRRDIRSCHPHRRCIQVIECILSRQSQQFRTNSKGREARFHSHHCTGLLDRFDDSFDVHRFYRA